MKKSDLIVLVAKENELRAILREEIAAMQKPGESVDNNQKLSRTEAAYFLGVKYGTMYHLIKRGEVKEHKIGGKKYFLKSELIEKINR